MGRLLHFAVMALVAVGIAQTRMAVVVVVRPIPLIWRGRMWMWMEEVGWVGDVRLPLTLRTHNPRSASSVVRSVVGRRSSFPAASSSEEKCS